jgi:hypothetical protein
LSVLSRIVFDPDVTPPTVPGSVTATALSQTTIRVSWSASTDSGGSGLAGYVVYRSTTLGGTYAPISSGLSVASLSFDDTSLSQGQQRFYKVLALDGNGNQSALSAAANATTQTSQTNQPPVWTASFLTQSKLIGEAVSLDLDQGCSDPEGQPITYITTASELSALGLAASGARGNLITGTLTAQGSFGVIANDSAGSAEAEWTARKASVAGGLIMQEDFSTYADRAAWMAHMLAVRNTLQKVVVSYAYTGVSAGDPSNYDPVPSGQQEKIGFDTTNFLTGGKAAYVRFRSGEGASDNGPTFGIPISNPTSRMYFQMDVMFDAAAITNDYASSHRKLLFLNQHDFESGQIVAVMYDDHGPWPSAYRVTGTTRTLARFHPNPPSGFGPDERQVYGAYDTNPGAAYPTTVTAFKQRFGPSRDFPDLAGTDPDYAAVPRIIAGAWYTLTYYVDQDWIGTTSRGMWKLWIQAQGQAPVLIGLNFQDCAFDSFAETPCSSIRPVWRPELSTGDPGNFPSGVDHGVRFDKLLVSSLPPTTWGHALPYPGQQIPPGMPITGTTDE